MSDQGQESEEFEVEVEKLQRSVLSPFLQLLRMLTMLPIQISTEGIVKLLKELKLQKAPGPDCILWYGTKFYGKDNTKSKVKILFI